jgi:tetratricopeptide (TPR) repeat protein
MPSLRDAFNTLSAIAQAIAAQLGITPIEDKLRAARKPTEHLPAYNLYLQGRYLMYKATPEYMAKAKQCFEDAIAADPEFALAYDSLAEIHWYLGFLGLAPPKEVSATGMFYALRALEIDNTLAETHALLGMYREQLDYNWPEVSREMARALELNPTSPVVRLRYAVSGLMPHGRIDEAVCELERALESDPLSTFTRFWLGVMFCIGRRWDEAVEQGRVALELDPTYFGAHFVIGVALREKRMFEEAVAAHGRAVELSRGSPIMLGWLGLTLARSGNTDEARAILDRLHRAARDAYVPPSSFAWIHLGLGEIDSAFEWMDRAIDARDRMIVPIKSYAFLDLIRADPRYRALLGKMNLEA